MPCAKTVSSAIFDTSLPIRKQTFRRSFTNSQGKKSTGRTEQLLNYFALQPWRKALLQLVGFLIVLHHERVQVLRAANLEFQRPVLLFLDRHTSRILPSRSDQKVLDFKHLLRLRCTKKKKPTIATVARVPHVSIQFVQCSRDLAYAFVNRTSNPTTSHLPY